MKPALVGSYTVLVNSLHPTLIYPALNTLGKLTNVDIHLVPHRRYEELVRVLPTAQRLADLARRIPIDFWR